MKTKTAASDARGVDADSRLTLEIRTDPASRERDLEELASSLTEDPRWIPARYFYDALGSELFEEITALPEYYQTRTEEALLRRFASEVIERSGATELLELGAGAAAKTRVLLDEMRDQDLLRRFVPIDVDPAITRRAARELLAEYPELEIHAIVTDLLAPLEKLPGGHHRLVVFLGGTIGNLNEEACVDFLAHLAEVMGPGDHLLLGVDRIKSTERLEAAYNDRAGVTAAFNRNMLRVVNEVADGDFEPDAFEHRAIYNEPAHRIEMWLRAQAPQRVRLAALDLEIEMAAGEAILTEISTKYDREKIEEKLVEAGFELERWYTDEDELFALVLARRI